MKIVRGKNNHKKKLEKLKDNIPYRLMTKIEESRFFKNTILSARKDGLVEPGDNKRSQRLFNRIKESMDNYISRDIEIDSKLQIIFPELEVNKKRLYKAEFVDFLAESIENVLSEYETT